MSTTNPSPGPPPPPPGTPGPTVPIAKATGTTISLNGRSLIIPTAKNTQVSTGILYRKEHRPSIGTKEEKELISSINTNSYDKYTSININIKDADSLKNNLTVTQRLVNTEEQWKRYDLLDPCHILFPDPSDERIPLQENGKTKTLYLFTDHRQVTANEVAKSCAYYSQWMQFPISGKQNGTFDRELTWSYTHFRNHVEPSLYEDVNTQYKSFLPEEQGGPLFLKLLLDKLVISNEQNLRELTTSATTYNIKQQCDGEDINQAVKLLTNVTNNIISLRHNREHVLPENYIQDMLKVFQTTSVDKFNASFQYLESDLVFHRRLARTSAVIGTTAQFSPTRAGASIMLENSPTSAALVWEFALSTYNELRESGEWDEALRKPPGESAFQAQTPSTDKPSPSSVNKRKPTCWNCGKIGHTLDKCPEPRDPAKIAENRNEFNARSRAPRVMFRPPEDHEDNKRIINGKPHEWHADIRRWKRIQTPPSGLLTQTAAAGPPAPPLPPQKPPLVSDDDTTVGSVLTNFTRLTDAQQSQFHLDLANIVQLLNEARAPAPICFGTWLLYDFLPFFTSSFDAVSVLCTIFVLLAAPSILLLRLITASIYTRASYTRRHRRKRPPCWHPRPRLRSAIPLHRRPLRFKPFVSRGRSFVCSRGRSLSRYHANDSQPEAPFSVADDSWYPASLSFPADDSISSFPSDDSTSSFLASFDVLAHGRTILSTILSLQPQYRQIQPTHPRFAQILLEARCLQSRLQGYRNQPLVKQDISVYLSSNADELPIVIDTGASLSLTPLVSDFSGRLSKSSCTGLKQLHGQTKVIGEGKIAWHIEDVNGIQRTLNTTAYYVPAASIRLFSPQSYIHEHPNTTLLLNNKGAFLTLDCGSRLEFPINDASNLPIILTERALSKSKPSSHNIHLTTTHDTDTSPIRTSPHILNTLARRSVLHRDNLNLTMPQRELLRLHCCLGHADFQRIQTLIRKPQKPLDADERGERYEPYIVSRDPRASSCTIPKCEACQYAKQRRTTPPNPQHPRSDYKEGVLSIGQLHPGDKVSCDQYMSTTLGRLAHTAGKETKEKQLAGGTMFIDHASNYIFHRHQINLTITESIRSKHAFESHLDQFGVRVKHYASDNQPFSSKDWITDCTLQQQQRSLSGVGAHHQNYMERHIQTIFNWSRASLLHFVLHWPQQAQEALWPFAVNYSINLWNTMPARDRMLSPYEIISQTTFENHHHLQRSHVFGCPVFVLDPRLQDAKKIPKWSMRSRRGVYLGVSPYHSSTVHLVLNPDTGRITPQYHLVFDDAFTTVFSDGQFDEARWLTLLHHGLELHPAIETIDDHIVVPPDYTPFDTPLGNSAPRDPTSTSPRALAPPASAPEGVEGVASTTPPRHGGATPSPSTQGGGPVSIPEGDGLPPVISSEGVISPRNLSPLPGTPHTPTKTSRVTFQDTPDSSLLPERPSTPATITPLASDREPQPLHRSTRSTIGRPPERLSLATYDLENNIPPRPYISGSTQTVFKSSAESHDNAPRVPGERLQHSYLTNLKWDKLLQVCTKLGNLSSFIVQHQHALSYTSGGTPLCDYLHPGIFQATANASDTPSFTEAMNGPDAAGFLKAMEIEINTLIDMDTFDVVDRTPAMKVISSVWAFKVKRFPDGTIKKLKAQICARGFEQVEGLDYFETFAPVVQWITVRLILIMTILLGLENQQIDYTAAFVQASIDTDVYVEMPKLFTAPGKVWKLKKCIYGLKQSPRNYFLHMKAKLEKLGFRQTDADPCLFISATVICLIYVDDALLVYRDPQAAEDLAAQMKAENMLFNVESDVAGYLGVLIDRREDGSIVMRQEGLAKRIVEALFLNDSKVFPTKTPAAKFLPIDADGEPALGLYNYASVVGMLNYLQGHSRIDISFAVSQVARFVHSPRRSHELALEQIGRYLKGTLKEGLVLHPKSLDSALAIDIYVDAAFACGWGTEEGTNPDSVKSRTGYIIEVMGCSVVWCSKLQTSIATSTMESEYTALSMALRAAIPLIDIFNAITKGLKLRSSKMTTFKATIHEDNLGALTLAKLEPGRHTPRSKFYALKLHWFRSWLNPRNMKVVHCPTHEQKADYLTKPLLATAFSECRKLSMGW